MAKKQTAVEKLIVYDDILQGKDSQIRLIVEVPTTEQRVNQYYNALRDARNIPFDLDNINPMDAMYRYVYEQYPNFRGNGDIGAQQAKDKVKFFYSEQSRAAYRDAVMLAIIADKSNVFATDPKPYAPGDLEDEDDLPGLIAAPAAEKNLQNATEARLKQFYDWLLSNPEVTTGFQAKIEAAAIKINEMLVADASDAVFQPTAVN